MKPRFFMAAALLLALIGCTARIMDEQALPAGVENGQNAATQEPVFPSLPMMEPPAQDQETTQTATPTAQPLSASEFVIEADTRGLYPDTITVKKGEDAKIIFKVRNGGVYRELEFKSDTFGTTGKVTSGNTAEVKFIAEESFEFETYCHICKRTVAKGRVVVE